MARSAAVSIENSFIKGLVTEATGLNFPENACSDTYDCVFDEKGQVRRRLGFAYESGYSLNDLGPTVTSKAFEYFVWENVAGRGDIVFIVVQFGSTLLFYQTSQTGALSANPVFSIDLTPYLASGAPIPDATECTFAAGNGALFVTHPYLNSFYVTWNVSASTHTETQVTINIRDFAGVDDTLDNDTRPSTLSATHNYNLYNQGWYTSADCGTSNTDTANSAGSQNVLTNYHSIRTTKYPSNSDVWWHWKNAYNLFIGSFDDRTFLGNSAAPKGHYILNALYQDRSSVSGVAGVAVVSSGYQRPSVCAFHSSRLFLGGVQADKYSNRIYFSQIVKDDKAYTRFYQSNDPTAESLSDLLPTDGGEIVILDAGSIVRMISVQNFLLVFASNGIWSIGGSQGQTFAANDYSIAKISDLPTQSSKSFVLVNGYPVWWNNDGIFTILFDRITGTLNVKTLTDRTIKTYYDNIPVVSKLYAKGSYNTKTKVIQWTYRSTAGSATADYHQHDRVLAFNTLTEAFYPWRISQPSTTNGPFVAGVLSTKGLGTAYQTSIVTDNAGVTVTDGTGASVTVSTAVTQYLTSTFRYVTIVKSSGNYKLTFSQESDATYTDWTATDYQSYLLSGYKVHGQAAVKFQTNYLNVFMNTETDASCYLQTWWDYTNTVNSGRVDNTQQCFHNDTNFTVSHRRLKVRGQGLALQFKFFSQTGKPFTVIGWSGFETGNTLP